MEVLRLSLCRHVQDFILHVGATRLACLVSARNSGTVRAASPETLSLLKHSTV